jgi:cytosine/adenosine deaminase-related metal-dependent hydrolase
MVRATDLNMQPMHDPVATLVTQASLANIDSVMIAGEFRKRDGRMAFGGLADRQQQLVVSGQRIMRELDARLQAAAH